MLKKLMAVILAIASTSAFAFVYPTCGTTVTCYKGGSCKMVGGMIPAFYQATYPEVTKTTTYNLYNVYVFSFVNVNGEKFYHAVCYYQTPTTVVTFNSGSDYHLIPSHDQPGAWSAYESGEICYYRKNWIDCHMLYAQD